MSIGSTMRVSASGMTAERFRMDVISGNIANANTVQKPGQPEVRRQSVVLRQAREGVAIEDIAPDQTPLRREYDPGNPNAINGWVTYTNINPVFEMVDMIGASRAYEANLAAFNTAKQMMNAALSIGKA
ncbi:MAG: flagellar basal body rod protein FlgC [Chthonomonas sp.]|nr:flagellar basal body rod protein FlgC [Chthonomonas sp.]